MSTSATPKQGDHVFNAVDAAILRMYTSPNESGLCHFIWPHRNTSRGDPYKGRT